MKLERRLQGYLPFFLSVLACVWAYVQLRPIDDVDLFTQIRLGLMTMANASLITKEPFSYLHLNQPILNPGWLAQLVFALLYRLGSWPLIKAAYGLIFAAAFIISMHRGLLRARDCGVSPRYLCLAAALSIAVLAAASNCSVRPQGIALLCFSLMLYVLENRAPRMRTMLTVLGLGLMWQNAHSSLSLALGALGVRLLCEAPRLRFGSEARKRIVFFCVAFAALALCQLATPLGAGILGLGGQNVKISRDLLGVTEWLPPWHPAVLDAMYGFWISAAVSAACILGLRRRTGLRELIECVCYTTLALFAARFVLFYALAMVPVWSLWLERLIPQRRFPWKANDGEAPSAAKVAAYSASAAVFALSLPLLLNAPPVDPELPLEGIQFLSERLAQGRVFNYREWGGPLALEGRPGWQLHIDGRLYLYGEKDWETYNLAAKGKIPVEDLERDFQPDAFFLHDKFHRNLKALLLIRREWVEAYHRPPCSVFLRRESPARPGQSAPPG